MSILYFVLEGPTVWGGLLALGFGLLLGLRGPMPQGLLLIGLGALAFVACLLGRLFLAIHLARTGRLPFRGTVATPKRKIQL